MELKNVTGQPSVNVSRTKMATVQSHRDLPEETEHVAVSEETENRDLAILESSAEEPLWNTVQLLDVHRRLIRFPKMLQLWRNSRPGLKRSERRWQGLGEALCCLVFPSGADWWKHVVADPGRQPLGTRRSSSVNPHLGPPREMQPHWPSNFRAFDLQS